MDKQIRITKETVSTDTEDHDQMFDVSRKISTLQRAFLVKMKEKSGFYQDLANVRKLRDLQARIINSDVPVEDIDNEADQVIKDLNQEIEDKKINYEGEFGFFEGENNGVQGIEVVFKKVDQIGPRYNISTQTNDSSKENTHFPIDFNTIKQTEESKPTILHENFIKTNDVYNFFDFDTDFRNKTQRSTRARQKKRNTSSSLFEVNRLKKTPDLKIVTDKKVTNLQNRSVEMLGEKLPQSRSLLMTQYDYDEYDNTEKHEKDVTTKTTTTTSLQPNFNITETLIQHKLENEGTNVTDYKTRSESHFPQTFDYGEHTTLASLPISTQNSEFTFKKEIDSGSSNISPGLFILALFSGSLYLLKLRWNRKR